MLTPQTNPLWYKDAIIYELHVKAFKDSNGDGTGDFRGLIEKLDYIQELGVTAIWLLPFYPSPFRDDGYDISDYRGIHPAYGTIGDFRALVREAHRRGLRIITELVVNHTSDQHHWFQAARRAKPKSARRNFYVWNNTNTRFPETRIIFTDTETSNWAWDPEAKAYYWHRFFSHQPDLNLNNPKVVQAVLKVMRFWLKMGVDGLRLDAVPYLCVRDGTNNENLPETHAVLKEFRRFLDRHFPGRMFLAEANQWPEDVRPYFGDNDECHMAFHFPIMPRIFMALRQEDRHPITDILERTPSIPDECQWALFLRNHDELTLEMVTDEERDYMYAEYAKDARMKLNLGIRRRLAPLLDNSRRRMELLNSLLFSLPGSPIIYYGDELGMGDNIFLGDRDGVRTPMQWNMDRNAGFSAADPARLYLPPIMDPVYGYQAVNVEAQERNPSSMLHFMRRLIALRRQHKAFGRGSIEFFRPRNRAILAYTRRYKGEIILAIANLSRFVQAAELNLDDFRGYIPVEMISRNEFPPVGELPYFITLGPHSFYWFRLEPQAEPIKIKAGPHDSRLSLVQLTLENLWDTLLRPEYLYALGNDILPAYLAGQRWFQGKARDMVSVRVVDWAKLGAAFYILMVEAGYESGDRETYVMPLKIVTGGPAERLIEQVPESVLATVKNDREEGILYDALADKTSCDILFAAVGDGRRYSTGKGGSIRAFPTTAYEDSDANEAICTSVRPLGAEQSNTSIVINDTYVLKLYRKSEAGPNPDVEVSLFLTERTDFKGIAPVIGTIQYHDASGAVSTIGMVQSFVPNQGDGWAYTLGELEKYRRQVRERSSERPPIPPVGKFPLALSRENPPPFFIDLAAPYLEAAHSLGQRTAEFHLALASEKRQRDFRPEAPDTSYSESLAESISRDIRETMSLINRHIADLEPLIQEKARRLLDSGPSLMDRLHELSGVGRGFGMLIRCHGDYHLGQVLRTESGDFILLDFEGEPLRRLAERRRRNSPLRDVAGMLRSFSYAAHTAFIDRDHGGEIPNGSLDDWRRLWEQWVGAVFLRAYLDAAGEDSFLPPDRKTMDLVLSSLLIEKACYELRYELNNRPAWLHIPLLGLLELAQGERRTET